MKYYPARILRLSFAASCWAASLLLIPLTCWGEDSEAEVRVATKVAGSADQKSEEGTQDEPFLSEATQKVLSKDYPETIEDLRLIEQQVQKVLAQATPATVGIRLDGSAGSGVIVSEDGLVLTAGHVSGEAGRDAVFIMPDGRRVRGKTLGLNRKIDSGMMKIVEEGPWPFVPMAAADKPKNGNWVVATGHPGGYQEGRRPPIRLGRVLYTTNSVICTDCTLVGGDSGGPLFNMKGEVIGIHSRIGRQITSNFHVPIATYHQTWKRLLASEVWGGPAPRGSVQARPYLGLHVYGYGDGVRIVQVTPGAPGQRAGLQADDIILSLQNREVSNQKEFYRELWTTRPLDRIVLRYRRGEEEKEARLVVGGLSQPLPGSPKYVPRQARSDSEEKGAGDSTQGLNEGPLDDAALELAMRKLTELGLELDPVAIRPVVSRIEPGSSAKAAGVRPGDIIIRFDGAMVRERLDLLGRMRSLEPGKKVELSVLGRIKPRVLSLEVPSE